MNKLVFVVFLYLKILIVKYVQMSAGNNIFVKEILVIIIFFII